MDRPPPPGGGAGPYRVTLHAQDIVTQAAVTGVTARLCRKLDVECEQPLSPAAVTSESGDVVFDVPARFTGYVAFDREDLLSGLYFFNPPLEGERLVNVQLASPGIAQVLAGALGVTLGEDRGLLLLSAGDCQDKGAQGVQFGVDGEDSSASVFYSVGGLPDTTVTTTDTSGYGGFLNVQPGTVTVTATLDGSARPVGTTSLLVRSKAITYGRLVPNGG